MESVVLTARLDCETLMPIPHNVLFPDDPKSWANTQPDLRVNSGEPEPDLTTAIYVDDTQTFAKHGVRRSMSAPVAAVAAALTTGLLASGMYIYGKNSANRPAPITNVTTTMLPRPTATRTRTVHVPGPVVTERLRSTVTARSTRTVPGPRMTVTVTPSTLSGTAGPR